MTFACVQSRLIDGFPVVNCAKHHGKHSNRRSATYDLKFKTNDSKTDKNNFIISHVAYSHIYAYAKCFTMSIKCTESSTKFVKLEQSELNLAPAMMATVISSQTASTLSVEEILKEFKTHETNGLPNDEIERRRMLHGWNEFDVCEETPLWRKYLDQVSDFSRYFWYLFWIWTGWQQIEIIFS